MGQAIQEQLTPEYIQAIPPEAIVATSESVEIGPVKVDTGHWGLDVAIALFVICFLYGAKKSIDKFFRDTPDKEAERMVSNAEYVSEDQTRVLYDKPKRKT